MFYLLLGKQLETLRALILRKIRYGTDAAVMMVKAGRCEQEVAAKHKQ